MHGPWGIVCASEETSSAVTQSVWEMSALSSWTANGIFMTATVVAGGSAAAMTLFKDVLKLTREAREQIPPPKPKEDTPQNA